MAWATAVESNGFLVGYEAGQWAALDEPGRTNMLSLANGVLAGDQRYAFPSEVSAKMKQAESLLAYELLVNRSILNGQSYGLMGEKIGDTSRQFDSVGAVKRGLSGYPLVVERLISSYRKSLQRVRLVREHENEHIYDPYYP